MQGNWIEDASLAFVGADGSDGRITLLLGAFAYPDIAARFRKRNERFNDAFAKTSPTQATGTSPLS